MIPTTTVTYDTDIRRLPFLDDKIVHINRKAEKVGAPTTSYKVTKTWVEIVTGNTGLPYPETWVTIEITMPEVVVVDFDVKYLGHYGFNKENTPISFTTETAKSIGFEPWKKQVSEYTCDHCHTNRARKAYDFFLTEDGRVLSIGSSCVKAYFGEVTEGLLKLWYSVDWLLDKDNDEALGESYGCGHYYGHSLLTLVAATYLETSDFTTWLSKAKAELYPNKASTGVCVGNTMYTKDSATNKLLADTIKLFQPRMPEIKAKLLERYGAEPTTEFDFNVRSSIMAGDEIGDLVNNISLAAYAVYSVMHVEAEKADLPQRKDEFVGKVGERLTFSGLKLLFLQGFDGNYGTSYLYKFEDAEGRSITTFASRKIFGNDDVGKVFDVKGTVKEHEVYRGQKQTKLSRIAVIENK